MPWRATRDPRGARNRNGGVDVKALGIDPVHDTRETFRSLVDATSRPGTVKETPATPADHAVIATLVDHEVALATDDASLRKALSAEGRLTAAPVDEADIVHVDGDAEDAPERLGSAPCGTLKEPSEGATVVITVDSLTEDVPSDGSDSPSEHRILRLTGPGVPTERTVGVVGLAPNTVEAIVDAQARFPRGIDVTLTADRQIAALPRSVEVEVT